VADSFVPPAGAAAAAKRAIKWIEEGKAGSGFTSTGRTRAGQIARREALSRDTVMRMVSFFARHEPDKKAEGFSAGEKGYPSPGRVAWDAWGGDAGRSWANRTAESIRNKEKATMTDLTTSYFAIEKADRNADGTLMVYGKATDDSIDIDQQICDAAWLDRAMPDWFKTGGNIREQHSSIAAGVAKEYQAKQDGHYIRALVVDPISVRKVETGVLKGFSIGIKNPRVARDNKAANGRIIDGQIVEVSLVDRPANPNCQLVLAKSTASDSTLVMVEDLIEKKEETDYESINVGGAGSEPADKELYNRVKAEAKQKFDVYPSAVANAWVVREYKKRGGKYKKKTKKSLTKCLECGCDQPEVSHGGGPIALPDGTITSHMTTANIISPTETPKFALQSDSNLSTGADRMEQVKEILDLSATYKNADLLKFDKKTYDTARAALAQLIAIEAEEMGAGSTEEMSLQHLLSAVHHLFAWYEGESEEGEIMQETEIEMAAHKDKMDMKPKKDESMKEFMSRCKSMGMNEKEMRECAAKFYGKEAEKMKMEDEDEKPAKKKTDKEDDEKKTGHKSVESEDAAPEAVEPDVVEEEKDNSDDDKSADVEAIIEQVVKSATESLRKEIADLVTATKAAQEKASTLESELAIAKSLAVAGGPKRTGNSVEQSNDLLVKAANYKAKANATTDPTLAQGYKQLAQEFFAKAAEANKQ
jgi:hypothetical protein